jgi:hypothetical protein
MPYKQQVPKAITLRGIADDPDLYWFLRERAQNNGRALSNEIVWILKEVKRQADYHASPATAAEWRKVAKPAARPPE